MITFLADVEETNSRFSLHSPGGPDFYLAQGLSEEKLHFSGTLSIRVARQFSFT